MKQRKALFVLNIIIFVLLIICFLLNALIVAGVIDAKSQMNDPNNENVGAGIGLALMLVFQIYLCIPYAICLIIAVISLCKKYFNWLSIANTVMGGVGVLTTILLFLLV